MSATVTPASAEERGQNPLRPQRLHEVIGQPQAKRLMNAAIDNAYARGEALPHTLLVGASGTGKTTFANALANEIQMPVFNIAAPVSFDTLLDLRTTMPHGSILFVDEIHLQAIAERRGRESITKPEVLFGLMEDRVLTTPTGVLPYPHITLIGATTDEGALPDAFLNRFPLRPRLVKYLPAEMVQIIRWNAQVLNVDLDERAVLIFARASRGIPREANNLVKNAAMLTPMGQRCDRAGALDVLSLIGVTEDGLTQDMVAMLTFLLTHARQQTQSGEVKYQASVSTIATAIGKSRDVKAVALRVEPFLIERGFVQVTHGGRRLTDAGIIRAKELL